MAKIKRAQGLKAPFGVVFVVSLVACGTGMGDSFNVAVGCPGPRCPDAQSQELLQPDAPPEIMCENASCNAGCRAAGYQAGMCEADGSCTCTETPLPDEVCDDGFDNNYNGGVDEGCYCTPGTVQFCYSGPPETRGVGVCHEGLQECIGAMEFHHWGPCIGQGYAVEEFCDGLDNDCDGRLDEGCESVCYPHEFARETICDNGRDDDCDTLIDCADPDCACCIPQPEICNDGIDNDCDGRRDCFDLLDCLISPPPENCHNSIDDDCDRYVDCEDPDCCHLPECYDPTRCGRDCCVPGTVRWCDEPVYCAWGRQQCLSDGTWGVCEETSERPPGCESYSLYNRECCLRAGECCQNYPLDDSSVGNCEGIAVDC